MKIDNMREEHQEKLIKDAEKLAREQEEQEKKEAAAKAAKEHKKYGLSVFPSGKDSPPCLKS